MECLLSSLSSSSPVRIICSFLLPLTPTSDTEIDWETYMVQTELYIKGQYNYTLITGPTGPLVYESKCIPSFSLILN